MSLACMTLNRPPPPKPSIRPAEAIAPANANDEAPRFVVGGGDLMTPAEAAAILSVSVKVLERWRSTGEGSAFVRLTAKTIRYRREDIEAFVAGRIRANTAAA